MSRVVVLFTLFLALAPRTSWAQFNWNLGTWSVGQVDANFLPGGGPWTVLDPSSLPPGTALRDDGPQWSPLSQSISGVATTPGTYTFTLSHSGTTYSTTIKITALTVKDFWNLPDAFVGRAYSFTLTALNNSGAVTWTAARPTGTACVGNPWPAGLSIDSATGTISGTPSAGPPSSSGFYNLTVQVSAGGDLICRGINLGVYDIAVSSAADHLDFVLPNGTQNASYSAPLTATGGSGTYHFLSSGFLPNGLVLDDDGLLHGTINTGPGKFNFTITATDTTALSRAQSMSLTVIGVPPALPQISPYGFTNRWDDCTVGWPCSRGIGVYSGGTGPFVWSAAGLPAGLSIRSGSGQTSPFISPGDGEIWGIVGTAGTYPITVTVTDATGASATQTFTLHVSELVQTDSLLGAMYGDPYNVRMRVIGGTPGAGSSAYSFSLTAGALPQGLTLFASPFDGHGFVTGSPLENGPFSVEFTFRDSGGHSLRYSNFLFIGSHTATININTFWDLGTITQGVSYSNQLQACCLPAGITWALDSGSLPPGMTLSPTGLLSGTPTASDTYLFRVLAYDSANAAGNFVVRQLKLVVTPVAYNNTSTLPYGNVGTPYPTTTGGGFNLASSVTPAVPVPTFALASGYLPPGLSLSSGGTLNGTPTASGAYFFTIAITSGGSLPLLRSFNVSIYPNGVNPPLSFSFGPNIGTFSLGQLSVQLFNASGGAPPYHYSLTSGAAADSFGMRVQDGQPLPTFFSTTTNAGYIGVMAATGSYNSSIRLTDSTGATFDRPFTFNVSSLTILSQTNPPKATAGAPYSFTLTGYGGTGAYAWSAFSLPPGFSIDSSTGVISASNPTSTGTFFTTIQLQDLSTLERVSVGFTFTVQPYAVATSGLLPRGTVGTAYNGPDGLQLSAPGCGTPVTLCTWSLSSSSLPSGMFLSSAGVLQGTPTFTFNGSFTAAVNGPNGLVSKVFSLQVVNAVQPLSITTGALLSYTAIGNSVANALFATGGTPPYNWTLQSGSLPTGVSLLGPGDTLSSTLTPGLPYLAGRPQQLGVFSFTLRVTDSAASPAHVDQAFTWNISALSFQYTNLPLQPPFGTNLTYNEHYHQPLLVMGGTSHYTWANLDPLPPGLALDSSTGVIDGTPGNTGFFSARIQVTDDAAPVHNTTINTVNFNIAGPTSTVVNFGAGANLGVIQQGFGFTRDLQPNGGTGPYTITVVAPGSLPPGFAIETGNAILANVGGSYILAGTPFVAGTFTFTLRAEDSLHNVGVRTFTMTIAPVTIFTSGLTSNPVNNSLPDASAGEFYSEQLTAWNNVGSTNWGIALGSSLPSGLSLTSAGLLSGTPGASGNFGFTLTATDTSTGLTVSMSFALRVSTMRFVTAAVLPSATVGVHYSQHLDVSGGGPAKTYSAPQGVPNGFSLSSDGYVSGKPGNSSTSTFLVTVSDGSSSLTRRFTLFSIFSNPGGLSFSQLSTSMPDATVGQNYVFTLNPGGGAPPYSWSVAAGSSLPAGLHLLPVSSFGSPAPSNFAPGLTLIAGAPTAADVYTFDLLLSDSTGATTRRTFTLHVASITVLSGGLKSVTTGVPYAQQLTVVGGTPPYTFSTTPVSTSTDMLPPGITLDTTGPTAGLLHGTTASSGSYSFALHVVDSLGQTFVRTYNLTSATAAGLQINSSNPADRPVGVNFGSIDLFAFSNSGFSPFIWSLAPGETLPAGLTLDPSGNLSGVPSVPGTYVYTLRATIQDGSGHYADHTFTLKVGAQIVSPPLQLLAPTPYAEIGTPFSLTLKAAGGVPPYTFSEAPLSPLPSWLTLSTAGVLSGTPPPQSIGAYGLSFVVTDSIGHSTAAGSTSLVVVDAGSAPPLNTTPNSDFLPLGSVGVAYHFPLDGDALRLLFRGGKGPFSWSVTAGSLPPGMLLLPGNNGQPTYLGGVPTASGDYPLTLTVHDALGQSLALPLTMSISDIAVAPDTLGPGVVGTPYSVTFTPSGGTAPYAFVLDTEDSDLPPGLSFAGGTLSGTPAYAGNFVVIFQVTDNVGRMFFDVLPFTVDSSGGEAPALTIAPRSVAMNYVIGSPAPASVPLSITTTSAAVPFTAAVMGIPGATLSAGAGTTPGGISLNLDVASLAPGTYVGIIGAKASGAANVLDSVPVTLTVQPAAPCSFTLTPSGASVTNRGGSASFGIGTSSLCAWTAVASDTWITITSPSSGTGSATVTYTIAVNRVSTTRSGSINVNGHPFAITQFGSTCSFAINPTTIDATSAGGSASIAVGASNSTCAWNASGLGATPATGSGSGTVTITIPPNTSSSSRTLTATIASQTLTVNQAGTACTVSLDTYSATSPAGGGSGTVGVTLPSGCGYSTVSGPSWITVVSGGTGSDSGTLVYSVDPNSTTTARSGTLTIGGETLHVSQAGLACSVTVDTSGLGSPFGQPGGSGSIAITTNAPTCSWTASSTQPWAGIAPTSGTGDATIFVTVAANTTLASRSATLTIAGQSVPLSQSELTCAFTLLSTSGSVPAAGGSGSVGVSAPSACTWTSTSNDLSWLSISSSGSNGGGDVQFVALPNLNSSPRSGSLTIAGQTYTVNQAPAPCSYVLSATGVTAASTGSIGSFGVTTSAGGCSPSAVSYASWISVSTSFGGTSGTVDFSVAANPTTLTRTGIVQVGDQTFTVTQLGGACGWSLNAYSAGFNNTGGSGSVLGSPSALSCPPIIGADLPSIITLGTLTGPAFSIYTQSYTVSPFSSLTIAVRYAHITFGGQVFTIKQTSW